MVTAIILRYKFDIVDILDRQLYLRNVCGVDQVIIVDNSKDNRGTARGYTEGLKQVKEGFVWLLDEDNIPEPNALRKLKDFWERLSLFGKDKTNICLTSYRKNHYDNLIDINSVIGSENSVLGLNVFNYRKTRKNFKRVKTNTRVIPCCVYGGMFFHIDLLKTIGYPDKKYFIYGDDYDWSYRITKNGGKIILVKDSIINEPESKGNIYYNTRNHLIFQKQFVTNKLKFFINYLAYQTYLIYKRDFQKLKALRDGYVG